MFCVETMMVRQGPRTFLMALLALLVMARVTVADTSANLTGTGPDPQHKNYTVQLPPAGLHKNLSSTAAQFAPSGKDSAENLGTSISENVDLDYDLKDIFGDYGAFDLQPEFGSFPSTFGSSQISPLLDVPAENTGSSDNRPFRVVNHLPGEEPFRTPPPLILDPLPETRSEDHITVHEHLNQSVENSGKLFQPGDSIPKIINRPGPPTDYSYTNVKDQEDFELVPVEFTPLSNESFNYPFVSTVPNTNTILNPGYVSSQGGASQDLNNGASHQASVSQDFAKGVASRPGASLNLALDAPTQASSHSGSAHGVSPQAGTYQSSAFGIAIHDGSHSGPETIFFPQDPSVIVSSYSEVPADSHVFGRTSGDPIGDNEEPYSGFLSTWWKTGSPREAATGFANNLWKSVSKTVGTKVAKKSKTLLLKAAPLVKKVVGAKAVASFFQGSNTGISEVGGVDGPVAAFVAENNALSATYGVPPTQVELARPEAPLPAYNAPPRDPLPTYGAPPKVVVQPVPLSLPEVHQYANDQVVNHEIKEDVKYAVPPPATKYGLPEPVKYNVPAPELLPNLPVVETVSAAPANHYSYPAVPQPVQLQAAPAPFFYLPAQQAQQVQYIAISPAQASHLIGNQAEQGTSVSGESPRGIFRIVDKVQEGYADIYNTYQYGRNLTNQATGFLGALWPGNWFSWNDDHQTETLVAPAAATIVSSYAAPAVAPIAVPVAAPVAASVPNPASPHYYQSPYPSALDTPAEGVHVYQYPANYDVLPPYSGYVGQNALVAPQGPFALSYVATLPGQGAIAKEEESKPKSGVGFGSGLGKKKIEGIVNLFSK